MRLIVCFSELLDLLNFTLQINFLSSHCSVHRFAVFWVSVILNLIAQVFALLPDLLTVMSHVGWRDVLLHTWSIHLFLFLILFHSSHSSLSCKFSSSSLCSLFPSIMDYFAFVLLEAWAQPLLLWPWKAWSLLKFLLQIGHWEVIWMSSQISF